MVDELPEVTLTSDSPETEPFDADSRDAAALIDRRYLLEGPLGGGLTATIWQARDKVLGRTVAVKLWRDGSSDALRSQEEELSSSRMANPHLANTFDAGLHRGRPYLVTELLEPDADEPSTSESTKTSRQAVGVGGPPPHSDERSREEPRINERSREEPKTGDRSVRFVVGAVIVAMVIVAAGLVARGPQPDEADADAAGPVAPIRPSAITTFDPEGNDGAENPDEAPLAIDSDPATAWSTDRYNSRQFGNLKSGVGLIVTLTPSRPLSRLELTAASEGWSAQVYVAETPQPDLVAWGASVASIAAGSQSERFDLAGRTVGAVLIWFTDLGDQANRLSVQEIAFLPTS